MFYRWHCEPKAKQPAHANMRLLAGGTLRGRQDTEERSAGERLPRNDMN